MRASSPGLPVATWHRRTVGGRVRAAAARLARAGLTVAAPLRSRAVPLALTAVVFGALLLALDLLAGSTNRAATAIDAAHREAAQRPATPRTHGEAPATDAPRAHPGVLFYVGAR